VAIEATVGAEERAASSFVALCENEKQFGRGCSEMKMYPQEMGKQKAFIVLALALTLLMCTVSAFALDTSVNRLSLQGLEGVGVLVEEIDPAIEEEGLTTGEIEKLVEAHIRRAGIKVLSGEDFSFALGRPAIYVNAQISKLRTQQGNAWGYLCSVEVALTQDSYLVRSPQIMVPAATWKSDIIGIFPDLKTIRDKITGALDAFVDAYQSANQKAKGSGAGT